MRILVGCEFSGTIRDAFRSKGHDAWSCDLQDSPGPFHIKDDVLRHLGAGWDLLIAHPPCTYLCCSGEQWLTRIPKYKLNPDVKYGTERFSALREASKFFLELWRAPIEKICLENPRMHTLARIQIGGMRSTQKIQPYEFGHLEMKETHLWLKNLPVLKPTSNLKRETKSLPANIKQRTHWINSDERSNERSRTYAGIAEAMSIQWSV